jgi:hypothetical protein
VARTTTATRGDVEQVKHHDRDYPDHQGVLHVRMAAVLRAQRRVARREPSASFELRQSLIDLASVAELGADELPRPTVR